MIPPQPWPMEVIVGLTIAFSFAAVLWVVIGVIMLVNKLQAWEDTRGDGE